MNEERFEIDNYGYTDHFVIRDKEKGTYVSTRDNWYLRFYDRDKTIMIVSLLNHLHDDYQEKLSKIEERIKYLESKIGAD